MVLAPFSLSGSRLSRLAEGALHLLSGAEFDVETPGITSILRDALPVRDQSLRLVCLRMTDQADRCGLSFMRRAVTLASWATAGRGLVVVHDRSLWRSGAQLTVLALIVLFSLLRGIRLRSAHARLGAKRAVKYLTGQRLKPYCPDAARLTAFGHLRQLHPDRLRLTTSRARRAVEIGADAEIRRTHRNLEALAAGLNGADMIRARLTYWIKNPHKAPPVVRRALSSAHLTNGSKAAIARRLKAAAPAGQSLDEGRATPGAGGRAFWDWFVSGAPLPAELHAPLGPNAMAGWQWLLCLIFQPDIAELSDLQHPWASASLTQWADDLAGCNDGKARIRLNGDAISPTGIGQNCRMIDNALRTTSSRLRPRAPAVIHAMNADRIPAQIMSRPSANPGYQIGHLLWEFDEIPRAHRLAIDMLDEIWTPSTFVAEQYRAVTDKPVIRMGKGIALPKPEMPRPRSLDVFRFMVAFDAHSSVERKNPMAAVRAFQAAFHGRTDVELVIKSTPLPKGHWGDPLGQMSEIRALAAGDPRMWLIEDRIPFARLLGLIADADALISTHRAEGFGYFPAYALMLGTAIVSTDYSGPQDFCSPQTGFPLPCRLVGVPKGFAPCPLQNARWAEPDLDALVGIMRDVVENTAEAARRTAVGQRMIQSRYDPAKLSRRYATRLSELGILASERKTLDQMFS